MRRAFGWMSMLAMLMPLAAPAFAADPAPSANAAAAASPTAARDRFVGTYTFSGGDKERKGIDAAIDRAISGLFFVEKPFAISQLHAKTAVKNSVGFSFANGKVTSTASDASPAVSPDDGTLAPYKVDGENLRISQTVNAAGHLIQIFSSPQGSRTNDYTLSADAKTLTMTVTLASSRLPQPVRYALTYSRNP
jgi:hypothetical protein